MRARDKGKEPKVKKKPGRTPTSCAECRRLKLRCDKNVPCEKCVSRGCGEICPNGVLTSTKGNRMILSGTEELHERILQLQGRVRDLESALRAMQAAVSDEPHPMLDDNRLRLPPLPPPSLTGSSPTSRSSSSKSAGPSQPNKGDPVPLVPLKMEEAGVTIDAFGTLTIGQDGAATYIGKTARSEFLIRAPLKQSSHIPPSSDRPPQFAGSSSMSSALLDSEDRDDSYVREQVYKMLPPLSEALHLCDIYLEYGKLLYTPITKQELQDEIFTTIYQHSTKSYQRHHALALLFAVFALASHFDPDREPYSLKSREYYELARTSLGFASPVRQTTLAAIQTLIHMAQYLDLTDTESQSAWMYIGQAVRFAFSIGLHLNATRWMLPQHEVERRSRVFWQLFTLDTWTSFCLGRPPTIASSFIDSEYPAEPLRSSQEMSFHSWSYRFATLLSSAMASGMGPKQPPYTTIVRLDRQIRDFHVPTAWRAATDYEATSASVTAEVHLSRWLVLADKETVILNLHRPYFAQALHDSPHDIHKHRYLPSVVAIYRASWRIVHGLQFAWTTVPQVLTRLHLPWSQALSAAIVLCLLVTKLPSSHLTRPSVEELKMLYALFSKASSSSKAAATLLPSIHSLCQKAQEAIDPARHYATSGYSHLPGHLTHTELDRLSGKTHLFAETGSASPSHSDPSSSSSSRGKYMDGRSRSTSVTLSDNPEPQSFSGDAAPSSQSLSETLHPVLIRDLKDFASRDEVPHITSLSDTPSGSESSTPMGSGSMATTPALAPAERPRYLQENLVNSSDHEQLAQASSYRHVHDLPRTPPHTTHIDPVYGHHTGASSSTETTPTHVHLQRSSGYPAQMHLTPQLHCNHRSTTTTAHPQQRLPPALPPGYTTEFQHYYETTEMRRATDFGAIGAGTGFVSGFEPVGTLMLDGTWQGFLEQLGF